MILRIDHLKIGPATCNYWGLRHGPLVDGWCSLCKRWAGGTRPGDAVEGDF